jgi:rsbT antagonist protein RsbS
VTTQILQQGEVLIALLQPGLTDSDLAEVRDQLSARVGTSRSRGVILDVSTLDVVDS